MKTSSHPSVDTHGRWHPFASGDSGAPSGSATPGSGVPASVRRIRAAAENVIDGLADGRPTDAAREAHVLHELAHGIAAADLRRAGVACAQVGALQARASSVAGLAGRGRGEATAQAANQVLQLVPQLYAGLGDPLSAELIKLEYLEREIALRSRAGETKAVDSAVKELDAIWTGLRERTVAAGGGQLAAEYRLHLRALQRSAGPAAVREQVPHGLPMVDRIDALLQREATTGAQNSSHHANSAR